MKENPKTQKNKAKCLRWCAVMLIILKIALVIAIMVFATEFKSKLFEGIGAVQKACKAGGKNDFAEMGDNIKKWFNIGYIVVLSIISTFVFFDLVGCIGAACSTNRFTLCLFIVFNVIFALLLVGPLGASATVAYMVNDPNNVYMKKFDDFANASMIALHKLFNDIRQKTNPPVIKQKFNFTAAQIDHINKVLKEHGDEELQNELSQDMINIENDVATLILDAQSAVDWLQQTFECCGMTDYHNWKNISLGAIVSTIETYDRNRNEPVKVNWLFIRLKDKNNNSFETWDQKCVFEQHECYVPRSCCLDIRRNKCNEKDPIENDVKNLDLIHKKPCKKAMVDKIRHLTMGLALLLAVLILLIICSIIAACCARNQLAKNKMMPHPLPKLTPVSKEPQRVHQVSPTPSIGSKSHSSNSESKSLSGSHSHDSSIHAPPKRLLPPLPPMKSPSGAKPTIIRSTSALPVKQPLKNGNGDKKK